MKRILVTGGAGYIGSHTTLELLNRGDEVVVLDNLSNAPEESLRRVAMLTGRAPIFRKADLCDLNQTLAVFKEAGPFDAVIHFAALKAVGESVAQPLRYYEHNLLSSLNLCKAMREHGCKRVVFSSSATVYGDPATVPVKEDAPVGPTNPYGQTKAMMEQILTDAARAEGWHLAILRYFNPVGAHPSGLIGEDPAYPNNLMPFVSQVAVGQRPEVVVFGDDWPTPDGTGVRDYIHVVDLAVAHLASLDAIWQDAGTRIWNIGTGQGASVLEVVEAYRRISGRPVPHKVGPRREGDVAEVVADPALATADLGWQARFGLDDMVASAWHWQQQNPEGFRQALPEEVLLATLAAWKQKTNP